MQITYIGHREGCALPAIERRGIAFNETVTITDPDLAASLLAQPENWVAADADTATFLRDFCGWVAAVQAITPPDPNAPVIDFDTPPATAVETPAHTAPSTPPPGESKKEREARERAEAEAAAAATNAGTPADKDGE